jgi:hypothetical protein
VAILSVADRQRPRLIPLRRLAAIDIPFVLLCPWLYRPPSSATAYCWGCRHLRKPADFGGRQHNRDRLQKICLSTDRGAAS